MNVTLPKTEISTKGYYYMKMIALICMLIDHIPSIVAFSDTTVIAMHSVGRLAFPIFAWELVQCYNHTRNKTGHLFSILLLAIISEPFFDLTFTKQITDWKCQNICFTLALGWIALFTLNYDWIGIEICRMKGIFKDNRQKYVILSVIQWCIKIAFCLVIGIIAQITNCDYGIYGIGLITFFALSNKNKHKFIGEIITIIVFIIARGLDNTESIGLGLFVYSFCFADIGIIGYYRYKYIPATDKTVNKALRLFCKWFYPVHLIILFIIGMIISLS